MVLEWYWYGIGIGMVLVLAWGGVSWVMTGRWESLGKHLNSTK